MADVSEIVMKRPDLLSYFENMLVFITLVDDQCDSYKTLFLPLLQIRHLPEGEYYDGSNASFFATKTGLVQRCCRLYRQMEAETGFKTYCRKFFTDGEDGAHDVEYFVLHLLEMWAQRRTGLEHDFQKGCGYLVRDCLLILTSVSAQFCSALCSNTSFLQYMIDDFEVNELYKFADEALVSIYYIFTAVFDEVMRILP